MFCILSVLIIVGCGTLDVDVQDISNSSAITGQVVKEEKKELPKTAEQAENKLNQVQTKPTDRETKYNFYDLEKLTADLNEISGIDYAFTRNTMHPDYVRSSHMDYYLIHTTGAKENFTYTAGEFCDKYCAANWEGWQYYINMSNYRSLFPMLGRDNFSTDQLYKEYLRDGTFVNYTFIETSYDVENGKVLEYQLISWRLDNSLKYFEGARDGTFLIYKIYCSPNMTILMTPRWETYKIYLPAATLEDSFQTWNSYILPTRREFLDTANELLARCGVDRSFFDDADFPDYSRSELLTGFWKVYYSKMFKFNKSLSISAKPKSNGKYFLHQVNVSFANVDETDYWNTDDDQGISLKIEVIPDGKSPVDYWNRRVTGIIGPGKSIQRSYQHKEVEFSHNITVIATLYPENNVELVPIEKTLRAEDIAK